MREISLKNAENLRLSNPENISYKLLRISTSLQNLQELYEPIDPDGARGKANERAFNLFLKNFSKLTSIEDLANKLDQICDELEPEKGFSENYLSLYSKLTVSERKALIENQSSSVSIVRSQSAFLLLDESNGYKVLRIYFKLRFIIGFIISLLGLIGAFLGILIASHLLKITVGTSLIVHFFDSLNTFSFLGDILSFLIGFFIMVIWVFFLIFFAFFPLYLMNISYKKLSSWLLIFLKNIQDTKF